MIQIVSYDSPMESTTFVGQFDPSIIFSLFTSCQSSKVLCRFWNVVVEQFHYDSVSALSCGLGLTLKVNVEDCRVSEGRRRERESEIGGGEEKEKGCQSGTYKIQLTYSGIRHGGCETVSRRWCSCEKVKSRRFFAVGSSEFTWPKNSHSDSNYYSILNSESELESINRIE